VAAGFGPGCAARPARQFEPAGPEEARRALSAWEEALDRSRALPAARLLYKARLVQGLLQVRGTLAVSYGPGFLEATLSGPFGAPVARYQDGALRGEGILPFSVEAEDLRSILAGVWRKGIPRLAGFEGGDGLLRWEEPEEADAVLDIAGARLRSLRVSRGEGALLATYEGPFDPWPGRVELEDLQSGNKIRLTLIAREPLKDRPTSCR